MTIYYKAIRPDKTSHLDQKTPWRCGRWVYPDRVDGSDCICGHGIHCSTSLLNTVMYQPGPSIYLTVQPDRILAEDTGDVRCDRVKALRWLSADEVDEMAGFSLWEVNQPHDPRHEPEPMSSSRLRHLFHGWVRVHSRVGSRVDSGIGAIVGARIGPRVWGGVWDTIRNNVGAKVWADIWGSIRTRVRAESNGSVPAMAWAAVRSDVWDSIWGYVGSLFPATYWVHTGSPWGHIRDLWLAGYVPIIVSGKHRLWTVNGLVAGIEATAWRV